MTTEQLYITVLMEGICLILILCLIISSWFRWRLLFAASGITVTIVFFSVWHFFMALGSFLTYAPASMLLWVELDKNSPHKDKRWFRKLLSLCWLCIAVGVSLLIAKNIYNIYLCLS